MGWSIKARRTVLDDDRQIGIVARLFHWARAQPDKLAIVNNGRPWS